MGNYPGPLPETRGKFHRYGMSWEMYRALAGQSYGESDKLLDETANGLLQEVLVFDSTNHVQVKHMQPAFAARFRASQVREQDKKFSQTCWEIYNDLMTRHAYQPAFVDALNELKSNLEKFDAAKLA